MTAAAAALNAKPRRSVESTAAPTRARLQTRDWAAAVLGAYDNRHRKRPWLGCYGRFASAFAQTCISYRRMVKTFLLKYLLLLKSIAQRSNADQSGLVCQTVHASVLSCRRVYGWLFPASCIASSYQAPGRFLCRRRSPPKRLGRRCPFQKHIFLKE